MSDVLAIAVALALLAGNAFFVGAEFALISARRTQIEPRAASGSRAARLALRAMERVSLMMAGAQLGITACSLGLGALGEPAVAHLIEPGLEASGLPEQLLHPVSFVLAMSVVVFLHMVLGEMVPKNIAIAGPERSALVLGPPLLVIVTVLKPFIWLLNAVANIVLRMLRVQPQDEVASVFDADQVAAFVGESRAEGLLGEQEHGLLAGALTIATETVDVVVVPRRELAVLAPDATVGDAEEACVRTGFSRFPLAGEHGELTGYVHLKDLLALASEDGSRPLPAEHVRPLVSISRDTPLDRALEAMQARGAHMAAVTGSAPDGVVGAAMLEDVVERLVGEVSDAGQETSARAARTVSGQP